MVVSLTGRIPPVVPQRALRDLVVPPSFNSATLDSFVPAAGESGQAAARDRVAAFAAGVGRAPGRRRRFRRAAVPVPAGGLYLDGGFGVGKTHLLAAAAHAAAGPVAYGSFMQFTALVGALGFAATRDELAGRALVCIDEFELDDPGDTVLMSSLLGELAGRGVALAATSNTLPGALGEDRFAAEDFVREIQGLAQRFEVVHLDGPDYRHRDAGVRAAVLDPAALAAWAAAGPVGEVTLDGFAELVGHLARVHPAAYGALLDGVGAVAWRDVVPLPDESAALRLVVLVDRLYDAGIPVRASGLPLTGVFGPQMLAGGYRKKYGRARSRLAALTRR